MTAASDNGDAGRSSADGRVVVPLGATGAPRLPSSPTCAECGGCDAHTPSCSQLVRWPEKDAPADDHFYCDSCGERVDPYADDDHRGDLCGACAAEEDLTASDIAGIKGDTQRGAQKDGD